MPDQAAGNQNTAKKALIFLDMDGVLTDFESHAEQENKLTPDGKLKYAELDYKWWATMPEYEGAKAFYDEARQLGATRFLTGPTLHEDSYSGKAAWLQKFVPERGKFILQDLMLCRSEEKYLLAQPNRILVDDRIKNIEAWEAAGGIGIHHKGDFADTLKRLQEAVAKVEAEAKQSLQSEVKASAVRIRAPRPG
jgi:hypothetical protein